MLSASHHKLACKNRTSLWRWTQTSSLLPQSSLPLCESAGASCLKQSYETWSSGWVGGVVRDSLHLCGWGGVHGRSAGVVLVGEAVKVYHLPFRKRLCHPLRDLRTPTASSCEGMINVSLVNYKRPLRHSLPPSFWLTPIFAEIRPPGWRPETRAMLVCRRLPSAVMWWGCPLQRGGGG